MNHRKTTIDLQSCLNALNAGEPIEEGSSLHEWLHVLSQEALELTAELNGAYHPPEKVRELFFRLTGKPADSTFRLFPPFYTDCGKNIRVGKHVFINMGCKFQDQGGIHIGNGCLIGHNVLLLTLNHDLNPAKRGNLLPEPIHIGNNVWIGSGATILPGVAVGDGAVVAAGAVVSRDVPANTVVGGIPAKVIKKHIDQPDITACI